MRFLGLFRLLVGLVLGFPFTKSCPLLAGDLKTGSPEKLDRGVLRVLFLLEGCGYRGIKRKPAMFGRLTCSEVTGGIGNQRGLNHFLDAALLWASEMPTAGF